jgi:uncharacterized membrane protein HdeD (DUF308 family)
MAFAISAIGLIMVLTGINNTYAQFAAELQNDFGTGYLKWAAAMLIVGAFGYIPELKTLSIAFMVLILLSIFLSNKGGVFGQVTQALAKTS